MEITLLDLTKAGIPIEELEGSTVRKISHNYTDSKNLGAKATINDFDAQYCSVMHIKGGGSIDQAAWIVEEIPTEWLNKLQAHHAKEITEIKKIKLFCKERGLDKYSAVDRKIAKILDDLKGKAFNTAHEVLKKLLNT
jgi:hypothetical protein